MRNIYMIERRETIGMLLCAEKVDLEQDVKR
jgi:hypothetical protein